MRETFRSMLDEGLGPGRPAIDVREEDNAYVVEADMPGMREDDIDVRVDGRTLTVAGSTEQKDEERDEEGYIMRERRRSAMRRSLTLPTNADTEGISARFRDGVLEVTVPKTEKESGRRIEVNKG
jgi:HSP20 family molecular chaperone IbpA